MRRAFGRNYLNFKLTRSLGILNRAWGPERGGGAIMTVTVTVTALQAGTQADSEYSIRWKCVIYMKGWM